MKFGLHISGQQDGNEDLHYIEYKLLKKRIKDVVARLSTNELAEALTANVAFEEDLAAEIRGVNNCFSTCQNDLLQRIASLSEEFAHEGPARLTALPPSSSGDGVAGTTEHQHAALSQLVGLLREVDRLRKYAVWNAVAVVKILKKRRKQTSFGLEDSSSERAGWLARQSFFSGSEFAELHAAVESLGQVLMAQLAPGSQSSSSQHFARAPEQCPICLDTISDLVELGCKHRFCWKCFVLGPIAFQPGEYRMSQCPICRSETTQPPVAEVSEQNCTLIPGSEGLLTRFLHTYFPQSGDPALADDEPEQDDMDVVGELIKVVLTDANIQPSCSSEAKAMGSEPVNDFFKTLPPAKSPEEQAQMRTAQKLQWLQLASCNDPLAVDASMYCSLCSEPLLMEAVVTTPCKHHFHHICVKRLDEPKCPLCLSALPFSYFLPADHPLKESGFRVCQPSKYRPHFPGGPSKGCGGFPLHRPPPMQLLGPGGSTMKSYLHRIPPMGSVDDEEPESPASPHFGSQRWDRQESEGASSASGSSSEDTNSEDGLEESESAAFRFGHDDSMRRPRKDKWAYSALGRMRLCTGQRRSTRHSTVSSSSTLPNPPPLPEQLLASAQTGSAAADAGKRVLSIAEHL